MSIPGQWQLIKPLLEVVADGREYHGSQLADILAEKVGLTKRNE